MTYSSSLALGRKSAYSGRGQNGVAFRSSSKPFGPISNSIILIVLACLLGLLYLTQVTKTNAYGYEINKLQEQRTELKEQHADLEVASARLQALNRVQDSDAAKSLVSVAPTATLQ
jgi:hypothetical protein